MLLARTSGQENATAHFTVSNIYVALWWKSYEFFKFSTSVLHVCTKLDKNQSGRRSWKMFKKFVNKSRQKCRARDNKSAVGCDFIDSRCRKKLNQFGIFSTFWHP